MNCKLNKEFTSASTRREMSSQLASQFDPMGIASPFLLKGKLLLQQVAISDCDWEKTLPEKVQQKWKKWLATMDLFRNMSIPRNCFPNDLVSDSDEVEFQLYAFCDASNSAYCCVVYLRCFHNEWTTTKFLLRKSRLMLTIQVGWVISRKELEAAKISSELMVKAEEAMCQVKIIVASISGLIREWCLVGLPTLI